MTAFMSRKIIKYGGFVIVGLVVLQWGVSGAIAEYRKRFPPYEAPTIKYGRLAPIVFPNQDKPNKKFTLELPNDSFPKLSDQARVYMVFRPVDTFLALDEDTKVAKALGFANQPTEVKTGVYKWENQILNQTLTINVLESSFQLKYPYENDQLLQNPDRMPTKEGAISMATNLMSQAGKMTPDLEGGEKKISYWKIGFDGLKSVTSLSDAHLIRVDFFRKETDDGMKIIPSNPEKASVSVLVSGSSVEGKKVVEASYKYTPIDRQSFSTYPIKTPQQAWQQLQTGNYWLAVDDTERESITIRKIYLAYFEPVILTNVMQPIYVLEGDNGFVAYLPAVADSMISER